MGFVSATCKLLKTINAPFDFLEDWAKEPLKRWENKREQDNKDRDAEREIRKQTGVETVLTDLKIKMETEIVRINAETEQWIKDQEFQRTKEVTEAMIHYREKLTTLHIGMINAIANMNLELREKAQNLILEKTRQYKELQDKASSDAEAEFERIMEKFSGNERIMNVMIGAAELKLVNLINTASQFLIGLNNDIVNMNKSIDDLTRIGQNVIEDTIGSFGNSQTQIGIANAQITELP